MAKRQSLEGSPRAGCAKMKINLGGSLRSTDREKRSRGQDSIGAPS